MIAMAAAGMFSVKRLPAAKTAPVAAAYAGFVVFNNLSIQVRAHALWLPARTTCMLCVLPAAAAHARLLLTRARVYRAYRHAVQHGRLLPDQQDHDRARRGGG